jgi:hypothetical protein
MSAMSDMLEVAPNAGSFDETRWRRRVGLGDSSARVFVCTEDGFYSDFRTALMRRGWRQAPWGSTPYWSLALALKPVDVDHFALRPGAQMCNSFSASTALCNKAALVATLASGARLLPVPLAAFIPRSYDLDEPDDYAAFIDDYRATAADAAVRATAAAALSAAAAAGVIIAAPATGILPRAAAAEAGAAGTAATAAASDVGATQLLAALDSCASGQPLCWDATLGSAALRDWITGAAGASAASRPRQFNLGVVAAAVRVAERAHPDFDDDTVLDSAAAAVGASGAGGSGGECHAPAAAPEPPLATDAEWKILRWCSPLEPGGPMEQAAVAAAAAPKGGSGACAGAGSAATAIAAQLKQWRGRAEAEAPSRAAAMAAATVFSPSVGDPPPSLGADDAAPELRDLATLPASLWRRILRVLRAAAAHSSTQPTLSAVPSRNVWIVKPSGKSRGRGIACESRLSGVLARRSAEAGATKAAGGGGFIAQKYLERPLLVQARKFDIRQWVLVTSWAPLEAWAYAKPYLRFCAVPFSLEESNVADRFAHLSNNSVQKHCEVSCPARELSAACFTRSSLSLIRRRPPLVPMSPQLRLLGKSARGICGMRPISRYGCRSRMLLVHGLGLSTTKMKRLAR